MEATRIAVDEAPAGSPRRAKHSFGAILRGFRKAAGLSQEALAELAQLSVDGIGALERGVNRAPRLETLALLVRALRLTPDQQHALETATARLSTPRDRRRRREFGLPLSTSSLYGRDREVSQLKTLLASSRAVTLIGPGGVGKTRLALEVATELARGSRDGARYVDLAPLQEPGHVLAEVAAAIEVREVADQSLTEELVASLRRKRMLLVLDNCEHVLESAGALVESIVRACEHVRVLVTSREPLRTPGELTFRVPSLSFPEKRDDLAVAEALEYPAIALFVDRAHRATESFALTEPNVAVVAGICARLDGIALAIELAAARLRILSPEQLEERLSGCLHMLTAGSSTIPRHATMKALVDWSYDLLTADEKTLFVRLAVFAGEFSMEAAIDICSGQGIDTERVFELLGSLVDKSLLTSALHGKQRYYRFLECTRDYALELGAIADKRWMRRHAQYYCVLAERAEGDFATWTSTSMWAESLELELRNLRAALEWSLGAAGDLEIGARLLSALREFWLWRGLAAEAAHRAEKMLDRSEYLSEALQAAVWGTLAHMRTELLTPASALEASTSALELSRRLGDRLKQERALRFRGMALMRLGELAEAEQTFEEAANICRDLGDERELVRALGGMAAARQLSGRGEESRALMLQLLDTARVTGEERIAYITSVNLAETEFGLGEAQRAVDLATSNLASDLARKNARMRATQETNLAAYLFAVNREDEARSMAMRGARDARETGDRGTATNAIQHLAALLAAHDTPRAARLLGFVDRTYEAVGYVRETAEQYTYSRIRPLLEERLSPDTIERLRREGATLTEDQAIRLASRRIEGFTKDHE